VTNRINDNLTAPDSVTTDDSANDRDTSVRITTNGILDRSTLLSFVGGDETLLQTVCALFLSSFPQVMAAMRAAIEQNDGNALARSAHTLRGSGGFFLTETARNTLTDLELIGRSGDLNSTPALLVDFESEMERLRPELSMLAGGVTES
jgi:HPt (histidine-containing phosphotransfer) domain-containing protein